MIEIIKIEDSIGRKHINCELKRTKAPSRKIIFNYCIGVFFFQFGLPYTDGNNEIKDTRRILLEFRLQPVESLVLFATTTAELRHTSQIKSVKICSLTRRDILVNMPKLFQIYDSEEVTRRPDFCFFSRLPHGPT